VELNRRKNQWSGNHLPFSAQHHPPCFWPWWAMRWPLISPREGSILLAKGLGQQFLGTGCPWMNFPRFKPGLETRFGHLSLYFGAILAKYSLFLAIIIN